MIDNSAKKIEKQHRVKPWALLDVKNIIDERGELFVVEENDTTPFKIKRFFVVRSAKGVRGCHAHRKTYQFLFPLRGTLDVYLESIFFNEELTLTSPSVGLLIPPLVWSEQRNFSDDVIYCVAASEKYQADDYITDRNLLTKIMC